MSEPSPRIWRVAVIGAGAVVQRSHIPNFQALPNAKVVAVCDINLERARQVAQAAGIPGVYTDYQTMLAEVRPEIVVVATPNIFHKPMTLAALEAGAHVLCEKPLALTAADAVEMLEKAREVDRVLTVGTHYRWSAPIRAAKAHIDGGFCGEIYAARTVWHRRAGIPGFGSWFTRQELAGGGALLDIGIHALDRALHLMGYPQPLTVTGATYAKLGPQGLGMGGWGVDRLAPEAGGRFDVDDLAWGMVRLDNGAVLILQVSWAVHMAPEFITEIFGDRGGLRVGHPNTVELFTTQHGQLITAESQVPRQEESSYTAMVRDLLRYLEGDTSARIITPEEALNAVRIIEGIQRSAESGREVVLAR